MRAYQDRYPSRDLTAVQRAPQDRKSATMRARSKPDATTCSGAYQRREGSLGNKVRPIGNGSVESNAHKGTARIPTWGRMHPDRTKHFHLQAYSSSTMRAQACSTVSSTSTPPAAPYCLERAHGRVGATGSAQPHR